MQVSPQTAGAVVTSVRDQRISNCTPIIRAADVVGPLAWLLVIIRRGNVTCRGSQPVGMFTLLALLYAAGLDRGLTMFSLTELRTQPGMPLGKWFSQRHIYREPAIAIATWLNWAMLALNRPQVAAFAAGDPSLTAFYLEIASNSP